MHPLRTLLVSLCLATAPLSVLAQVGERRTDFAIGGNIGWTLTRVSFTPSVKQSYKSSPSFGFVARYISEKYFTAICGLQAEVNYVNLGWKEVIEDGTGNEYTHDLHYVQVPFLMQMGWGRERRGAKFLFEAGPQFGYRFSSKGNPGGQAPWDPTHRPGGVDYQYGHTPDHAFDYGITAGLGMELTTAIGHFMLDARYYYALSDIFDSSKQGYFARSANNTISVRLAYLFDLHRTSSHTETPDK